MLVWRGSSDMAMSQTLHNLKGKYRLSYRYKVSGTFPDDTFTCSIRPKIGDSFMPAEYARQITDWVEGTGEWSTVDAGVDQVELKLIVGCYGDFMFVDIHFDDITLTLEPSTT